MHFYVSQIQRIAQVCVVSNLRRAARAASHVLDQALSDSGLTANQFAVLSGLIEATANHDGPITLGQLARRLAMDRTTLHRVLLPLRRAQLIDLIRRRGRHGTALVATARAVDLLATQLPRWQLAQEQFVRTLGEGDAGRFLSALNRIAAI
ncbi:MAG: winged helix-turn-helix transcriptional regulator [Alphaproteobacteria bacterium]|nr:winged helix-turn-helix transcriptional regulator [Alphaproteobacteria bacterium]